MNKKILALIHEAITVDKNYLDNMLEIHRILNGIENKTLVLTKNEIVDRNQHKKE